MSALKDISAPTSDHIFSGTFENEIKPSIANRVSLNKLHREWPIARCLGLNGTPAEGKPIQPYSPLQNRARSPISLMASTALRSRRTKSPLPTGSCACPTRWKMA